MEQRITNIITKIIILSLCLIQIQICIFIAFHGKGWEFKRRIFFPLKLSSLTCCIANLWLVTNEMKIALLQYLQGVPYCGGLPDPDESLSAVLKPSAIKAANTAVSATWEGACHRPYNKLLEDRAASQMLSLVATNATLFLDLDSFNFFITPIHGHVSSNLVRGQN